MLKKLISCLLVLLMAAGIAGCANTFAETATALETERISDEALYPAKPERIQQVGQKESVIEYEAPLAYVLEYPKVGNEKVDAQIKKLVEDIRLVFHEEYTPSESMKRKWFSQRDCDTFMYLDYDSYLLDDNKISLVFYEVQEASSMASSVSKIHIYHFDLTTGEQVFEKDLMREGFREAASAYTKKYFTEAETYRDKIFGDYETILKPDGGLFDHFALSKDGVIFYFDQYTLFPGSMGTVKLEIPNSELKGLLNGAGEEDEEEAKTVGKKRDIDPKKPMVALTFDDGPNPKQTGRILDVLEKHDVVATFFDLGSLVDAYPETVKREVALGCEVGSHSYSHKNFNKLSDIAIREDVERTAEAFENALGEAPSLFRPPYGNCDTRVQAQIPLAIVTWSVDTLDWKSKSAKAVMNMVKQEGDLDGKVVLMHGIYSSSADATEELVPYLLKEGYQLVTISELLEYKHGIKPEKGKMYGYSYFQ